MRSFYNKLFSKVDHFLFSQIDLVKTSSFYAKSTDLLAGLDEDLRQKLNQFLAIFLTIIPIIILFIIWNINSNKINNIELKEDILKMSIFIQDEKTKLRTIPTSIVDTQEFSSINDVNNKLQLISNAVNIDKSKLTIENFTELKSLENIKTTTSDLIFTKLTITEVKGLIDKLVQMGTFKIETASFNRDHSTKLLSGRLAMIHLSKKQNENL